MRSHWNRSHTSWWWPGPTPGGRRPGELTWAGWPSRGRGRHPGQVCWPAQTSSPGWRRRTEEMGGCSLSLTCLSDTGLWRVYTYGNWWYLSEGIEHDVTININNIVTHRGLVVSKEMDRVHGLDLGQLWVEAERLWSRNLTDHPGSLRLSSHQMMPSVGDNIKLLWTITVSYLELDIILVSLADCEFNRNIVECILIICI